MNKPKPPKCCGEVIQNSIFGKEFWYCRGCKLEVPEWTFPTLEVVPDDEDVVPILGSITSLQKVIGNPVFGTFPSISNAPPVGISRLPTTSSHNWVNTHPNATSMASHCTTCGMTDKQYYSQMFPKCKGGNPAASNAVKTPTNTMTHYHNFPVGGSVCLDCGTTVSDLIYKNHTSCP